MQDHERTDRGDLANAMRRIRFDAHHVGRLLEGCAEDERAGEELEHEPSLRRRANHAPPIVPFE